jgi:MFS family permease
MFITKRATTGATVGFAAAAMLTSYLPFSAVNGVLGTIRADFQSGTGRLQWVTDSFTVALTGAVLTGGPLAERLGRRRVTIAGLMASAAGSLIAWVAAAAGVIQLRSAGSWPSRWSSPHWASPAC